MFDIEIAAFGELLPKLDEVCREKGLPLVKRPESYFADGENGFLVMEDLRETGFAMTSNKMGMKDCHMVKVLEQLALVHASSYLLVQKCGYEQFSRDFSIFCTEGKLARSETQDLLLKITVIVKDGFPPQARRSRSRLSLSLTRPTRSLQKPQKRSCRRTIKQTQI